MTSKSEPHPKEAEPAWLGRLLDWVAYLAQRYAILVVALFAILVGLSVYYAREIPIRSSLFDLLPQSDPVVEKYQELYGEIAPQDYLAVLLRLSHPPSDGDERERILFSAADRLIASLHHPEIKHVSYTVGEEIPMPEVLLLFRRLEPEELERLSEIAAEVLERLPPLPTVDDLVPKGEVEVLATEVTQATKAGWDILFALERLPELEGLVHEAAEIIRKVEARPVVAVGGEPLLSRDRTKLLVQVWPREPAYDLEYSRRITQIIRAAIAQAKLESIGVTASIAGPYAQTSEAEGLIREDMNLTTLIASVGMLVLLLLAFLSPFLTVVAMVPMLASIMLTVAWAKFAVGGLNLITTFLPALVIGLGDDFSFHLLSRYAEERAAGRPAKQALSLAIRRNGSASLDACLTTCAVFVCLLFSQSRALAEMGAIMALGIFIAFLAAMFLIPSLITLGHAIRRRGFPIRPIAAAWLKTGFRGIVRQRRAVVGVGLILTLLVVYQASQVEFRFVSAQLAPETEAQAVLEEILREFGGAVPAGSAFVFFCPDPERLREVEEALRAHPLVSSTSSVRDLLPQELLRGSFQDIPVAEVEKALQILSASLARWDGTIKDMEALAGALSQLELVAALAGRTKLAVDLSQAGGELLRLATALRSADVKMFAKTLSTLEKDFALLSSFHGQLKALGPEPVLINELLDLLPTDIKAQYYTPKGRYILHAWMVPGKLYDEDNLAEFLGWATVLGVDYFGLPEITAQLEAYMKRDFAISTSLSAFLIFILVWVGLRDVRKMGLALAPLAIAYVWMLAGMRLLGIEFNFTNIVISPLLIGIGVDSAIHLLHRIDEEGQGAEAAARGAAATSLPILTSSLTTMLVFGALILARTPGLRFLGISALLGLGFNLVANLFFLPAAGAGLRKDGRRNKFILPRFRN